LTSDEIETLSSAIASDASRAIKVSEQAAAKAAKDTRAGGEELRVMGVPMKN
jgi:hypothetical protein